MNAEIIDLASLPHVEAVRRLNEGAPAYLAVNPIEYHGPHLPLNTDHIQSVGFVRGVHGRLADVLPDGPALLAPPLHVGVGPIRARGSVSVSYGRVRDLVIGSCRALADMGARTVFVMTFHGDPLHNLALEEGVRYLRRRGVRSAAPFHLIVRELLEYRPGRFERALTPIHDDETREMISREMGLDFHGGFFETSLMLYLAPDSVAPEYRDLPPCPVYPANRVVRALENAARATGRGALAGELGFLAQGLGWLGIKPFPGYTGWPHLASRECGELFATEVLDRYEPALRDVLFDRADALRPNITWLKGLSLGGRLAP